MKKFVLISGVVAVLAAATFYFLVPKAGGPTLSPPAYRPVGMQESASRAEAAGAPAAAGPVATQLSPEAAFAIQTLDEILVSRNDNDPRLDTAFRNLSEASKAALRRRYSELKAEDRNGRGTIVFLLGREIKSAADLDFFRDVMTESPCLSLADCTQEMSAVRGGDADAGMGVETTLAYPQIVDLVSLDRLISGDGALAPAMRDLAWKIVLAAKDSPIPLVARRAAELEKKLREKGSA